MTHETKQLYFETAVNIGLNAFYCLLVLSKYSGINRTIYSFLKYCFATYYLKYIVKRQVR